jgi:hypothetical protein
VAQHTNRRRGAVDRHTTRHPFFGWMKTIGPARKTRFEGTARVGWMFQLTAAAYNLMRMRTLLEATP